MEDSDDMKDIYGPQTWYGIVADLGRLKKAMWLRLLWTSIAEPHLLGGAVTTGKGTLLHTKLREKRTDVTVGLHFVRQFARERATFTMQHNHAVRWIATPHLQRSETMTSESKLLKTVADGPTGPMNAEAKTDFKKKVGDGERRCTNRSGGSRRSRRRRKTRRHKSNEEKRGEQDSQGEVR